VFTVHPEDINYDGCSLAAQSQMIREWSDSW